MSNLLRSKMLPDIPHGFSTKAGASANDVVVDAQQIMLNQVHSPDVVIVDANWDVGEKPEADALVTDQSSMVLGIVTADCAPVLFCDSRAGVIGAAHAGWRGAVGGVLENTVGAMVKLGASLANITAAIGPCIAQESYEVDDAMRAEFSDADHAFFAAGKPGHWLFDLPGFVASRLHDSGVGSVDDLRQDTYANGDRFFSYRRATHRGEPTGGRQISMIGLQTSE